MSLDSDHARFADWDGAYVLGALSPAERREYETHLEQCDRCRAAVAELTPLPGLLARLGADRAEVLLDEPFGDDVANPDARDSRQEGPSPQLLDLVRLEDRRRSRRRARTLLALAAAAVVVAIAITVPLVLVRPAATGQTLALESVSDASLTASVTLTPVEWGTDLELDCAYPESPGDDTEWSYGLYLTQTDGTTSELSTWTIAPGSTARISAGTRGATLRHPHRRGPTDRQRPCAAARGCRRLTELFGHRSRVSGMKKLNVSIAVVALALVGLTGCTSPSGTGSTGDPGSRYGDTGNGSPSAGSGGDTSTTGITTLTTATGDLGTIVVDDQGMTVYVYDKDTQGSGTSACAGQCLANWPAVTADQAPSLDGVTGDVGTITGTDGSTQVTLDGWPLYYYAGDSAAGDTSGQGVNNIWWVVGADGKKIGG